MFRRNRELYVFCREQWGYPPYRAFKVALWNALTTTAYGYCYRFVKLHIHTETFCLFLSPFKRSFVAVQRDGTWHMYPK